MDALDTLEPNIQQVYNYDWISGHAKSHEGGLLILSMKLHFLHFWRERPSVLNKFPPNSPTNSNLNLVHRFHRFLWALFRDFAYAFWEGGGPVYLANIFRKLQQIQI